jgi:membrane protein YdbS with pleckstrin-like domain
MTTPAPAPAPPTAQEGTHLPRGRIRRVVAIVLVTIVLVVALELVARFSPALAAMMHGAMGAVVVVALVFLIRSLSPRYHQRRHGERRHEPDRRHLPRG